MSDLVVRTEADDYRPVMSIEQMLEQREQLRIYVNKALDESTPGKADKDYGVIPGTGGRKILLLPGAQKLCRMRGLAPDYDILSEDEDWTGEKHGGEPFFNYKIKCILYREDRRMGSGVGACNSFEKKYRYVNSQRVCPGCGQPFIFAQKSDRGGGFFCWQNKGGCGRQFKPGTPECKALESQDAGKTANPDAADLQNTILKMAKKRAYIDATLSVVGASEFFTQDVDTEHKPQPPSIAERPKQPPQRHNEQVYEAEYVPQPREDADTEAEPAPTINKAQASAQLKAVLSDRGWEPANAQAYKEMLLALQPDKDPISWTAIDFMKAAGFHSTLLDEAIKKMYVPSAAEQPMHHTTDAAAKYQSPAAAIKESLKTQEAEA